MLPGVEGLVDRQDIECRKFQKELSVKIQKYNYIKWLLLIKYNQYIIISDI